MVFKEKLEYPDYSELLTKEQNFDFEGENLENRMREIAHRIVVERNEVNNDEADAVYDDSRMLYKRERMYMNTLEIHNGVLCVTTAFCVFFWYSRNSQYLVWLDVAIIMPFCLMLLVSAITRYLMMKDVMSACAPKGIIVLVCAGTVMTMHHIYNILQNDAAIIFLAYTALLGLFILIAKTQFDKEKSRVVKNFKLPSMEPLLNA